MTHTSAATAKGLEILKVAKRIFEEKDHCKHKFMVGMTNVNVPLYRQDYAKVESVCILGGLQLTAYFFPDKENWFKDFSVANFYIYRAFENLKLGELQLTIYNDRFTTTKQDILNIVEKAIFLAEQDLKEVVNN